MSRRGHTLLGVMTVVAAGFVASSVFSTRFLTVLSTRRADAVRWQLRWLATSACAARHEQPREVRTELGVAKVTRRSGSAEVSLGEVGVEVRCGGGP